MIGPEKSHIGFNQECCFSILYWVHSGTLLGNIPRLASGELKGHLAAAFSYAATKAGSQQ